MESPKTEFTDLVDDIRDYVSTNAELYKLQATEKAADMGADLSIGLVLVILASMAFVFVSIAAALVIGEATGKFYLGFLIVSAFYALAGIVLLVLKDKGLKESIANSIIRSIHKP